MSRGAPIDGYMHRLGTALQGAVLTPLGHGLTMAIEAGFVPTFAPERLSLIIAELVMNAAKHAFADDAGSIRVALRRAPGGDWTCSVSDNGSEHVSSVRGTGSLILDTLVRAIGGRMGVASTGRGTAVAVILPAPALSV